MAVRPILRFPHPLLRTAAEPVTTFDAGLAALAADLADTMRAAPGIGITGPHIGVMKRITVIELDPAEGSHCYVNPEIIAGTGGLQRHTEGSVSMPGVTDEIERPASVTVRYQDLDGTSHDIEASGLLSVCLQHEIDQLNGIFWIDRLSRLKRERIVKKFQKLEG